MATNDEIKENPPFTRKGILIPFIRKGICAECGKSLLLDSEGNSEYDFYQHRRLSTVNYKIDYHFCSRTCMQKKLKKQPLSNDEARSDTARQIFAEIESIKDEYGNPLLDTVYGKDKQYAKLKKKYKVD